MFTPKRGIVPEQTYRVDCHPSVEVLSEWYAKARKFTGIKHIFFWEVPEDNKKFFLSVHCHFETEEMEWRFNEEGLTGGKKMLWFYKTSDLAIIYPQILASVGATHPLDGEAEEKEKTKAKKPTSLGDRFKKTATTDLSAIYSETNHPDTASMTIPPAVQSTGMGAQTGFQGAPAAPAAVPIPPMPADIGALGGDLRVRSVPMILQTAEKDEHTGHLHVHSGKGEIVVQFGLGKPVHATSPVGNGLEAVMELFTWREGLAHFEADRQPEAASVQESTDELLRLGEEHLANLDFMRQHGLELMSVLHKPPIHAGSDEQLERRLQDGAPLGLKVQKTVYYDLDGNLSLKEIADKYNLGPSRTIAVAVNLLKLGLVMTPDNRSLKSIAESTTHNLSLPEDPESHGKAPLQPPKFVFHGPATGEMASFGPGKNIFQQPSVAPGSPDLPPSSAPASGLVEVGVPDKPADYKPAMSMQVAAFLHNIQTDIFTQEAFFYFLEREFKRAFRFSTEFTLVVFCIRLAAADSPAGLSKEEIRSITGAINRIKREVDVIGHLGERGFGLILPGVNSAQAANLIDRIMSELPQQAQGLAAYQPALHFGMASVPFDSKELTDLLSVAQGAMIAACQKNVTRLSAAEVRA
ncbi:MAG: DUF4388 domain-containing protein [Candidatus Melainabacteria bacterium]|nr:DUF4388 domain-containing protein [Candidatus Melainabacteria bacterium]